MRCCIERCWGGRTLGRRSSYQGHTVLPLTPAGLLPKGKGVKGVLSELDARTARGGKAALVSEGFGVRPGDADSGSAFIGESDHLSHSATAVGVVSGQCR